MNWILVLLALVLEAVHFATSGDRSLPFFALVLVTLAALVPDMPFRLPGTRPGNRTTA